MCVPVKENVTFTKNVNVQILQSDKHAQLPTEIKEVPEGKTWPQIRILIIVILCNTFLAHPAQQIHRLTMHLVSGFHL